MAEAPPKARTGSGTRKLKVALKLTTLLGLPLVLVSLIFGGGLYCGATRSSSVVAFEARWLGLEAGEGSSEEGEDSEDSGETGETGETPEPKPEPELAPEPKPSPAPDPTPDPTPEPTPEPKADPDPEPSADPVSLALRAAEPAVVGPELAATFNEMRALHVAVMVDPALLVVRDDWLSYVDALVESSSLSFQRLFGIELRLHAVVVWDAAEKLDPAGLLADLSTVELQGTQLVIGLVARDRPADFQAPTWTGETNGDHALVFADLGSPERYHRNMLRELARLFGAEAITEVGSEAWRSGSFMSGAEPTQVPVLDPRNRGRVIINKSRSFQDRGPAEEGI